MIFSLDQKPAEAPALLEADTGNSISYGEFAEKVRAGAERLLRGGRRLVFLLASNSADSITACLACLEAGLPVCLIENFPGGVPAGMLDAYRPDLVLEGVVPEEPGGFIGDVDGLHSDLALMLPTSGSTGSPKLVRLTRRNVEANAQSIATYLGLTPDERAMQSLPAHYSYGLSVLNSHLLAGASVVLTAHSFLSSPFWTVFQQTGCTSFAGVPFMYETLARLRFKPAKYPALRTMTQAGGKLKPELVQDFHAKCQAAGVRFFVMYGQTEATARISYVPPERLPEKAGAVGIAIPGGSLELQPAGGDGGLEELVYRGPNVMMGYAEDRSSLALGDELQGVLRTGDLGHRDKDGFFHVTGRLKRFAKLFGSRVSLDDVERDTEAKWPVRAAAVERDGQLKVFIVPEGPVDTTAVKSQIASRLGVPPVAVEVQPVAGLPLTSSGKKDYTALQ
jgi:long-chain acyl-CoA synthetase